MHLPRHGTYLLAGIQAFTQPVRSPPRSALSPTTQHGVRAVTAHARTIDQDEHQRYDYPAPAFNFSCQLVYDEAGLVLEYPGIAVRAL